MYFVEGFKLSMTTGWTVVYAVISSEVFKYEQFTIWCIKLQTESIG